MRNLIYFWTEIRFILLLAIWSLQRGCKQRFCADPYKTLKQNTMRVLNDLYLFG